MNQNQATKSKPTYQKIFIEFLNQSSIHGLKIFRLHVSSKFAKRLWFAFISLVIFWTHFIIANLTKDFIQQPTELHMSTNLVHVANTPFPGIAICSANKISRRKLWTFAEEVFLAQQNFRPELLTHNIEEMFQKLRIFSGFFIHPYQNFQANDIDLAKLHSILTFMYNNTNYPNRDIIHRLAPDCEDIVIRSSILTKRINISEYIVKRTTSSSICCMFNYRRESYARNLTRRKLENAFSRDRESVTLESNSVLNNVQFVVQMDMDDIMYSELSNDAFQLKIFPNEDYASVQSNTVGEIFVEHNTIIEIPILPRFMASSSSIRIFPPRTRKCYFPEEGKRLLNLSHYSMDECLLVCRTNSMMRYCGCASPPMAATSITNVTLNYCNIMDLRCLHQWKSIWFNWNFFDYVNTNDDEEKSSYEGCDHCLPTCDGVEFDFDWNTLPLRNASGKNYTRGLLAGLSNSKPLAIIRLFYQQHLAQETLEDVVADWILLLNRFGGILSLMYGFSVISYIEIVFYLTGKWFLHIYCQKGSITENKTMTKAQNILKKRDRPSVSNNIREPRPHHELYWNELKPKRTKYWRFARNSNATDEAK